MSTSTSLAARLLAFIKTTPGLLVTSALLALTPLAICSFVIIILVVARFIPFASGIITRLALSLSTVSCLSGCLAVIAWLMGLPLSIVSVLLLLVGLVGIGVWYARKHNYSENKGLRTNLHELSALAISLVTLILVAMPVLKNLNGATLLRVITAGGDNSAHLTMIKVVDLNQGIAFGNNNRVNPTPGAANYPEFWYFNVAVYKWLINSFVLGKAESSGKILGIFYGASLAWFGLLVFFMVRLGLRIAELVTKKQDSLGIIAALGVFAAIIAHWLLQLFTNGFQTQTASLVLLLAEVYVLVEAFRLSPQNRYPALVIAGLFAVGSSLTWTFSIPIVAGALAVCLLITIVANKALPPLLVTLLFVLLAAFIVFQPLLLFIFPVSFEGGVSILQQRGFINPVSMPALLILFIVCLLYLWPHKNNKPLRAVGLIAVGALLFSFGLMVYQLHTLNELRYFYHKSTYTFIVIGGALLAAGAYHFAQTIFKGNKKFAIAILLVALSGLVICQTKDPVWQAYFDNTLGGLSTPAAAAILQQTNKGPVVSANTTFLGACNRGDDIRANLFTMALTKTMVYKSSSFDPGGHNQKFVFEAIAEHLRETDTPITLVSSDLVVSAHLKAHLGELVNHKNFALIDLDNTPQTEPITQCPDRIRDIEKFPVQ